MSDINSMEDVIEDLDSENSDVDLDDFVSFDEAEMAVLEKKANDETEESEEAEESESKEKPKDAKDEKPEGDNGDKSEEDAEKDAGEVFKVKIDGKEEEVSLKDLKANYSGKVAYDKKFSELGEEKRQFKTEKFSYDNEKNELISKVETFVTAVKNGDGIKSVEALATLSGSNPVELRKSFIDLMRGQVAEYMKMSPEQQASFDKDLEIEYHKQRSDHQESLQNDKLAQQELETGILKMQARLGINDERLIEIYDSLEDKSNVSVEVLEQAFKESIGIDKTSSLLTEIDPSLTQDKDLVEEVGKLIKQNPHYSNDDVKEIVLSILEDNQASSKDSKDNSGDILQKRINKNKPKSSKTINNSQDYDDSMDDIIDFDDISLDF